MMLTRFFLAVLCLHNVLALRSSQLDKNISLAELTARVITAGKRICDLDDTKCLTAGSKRTYQECISGLVEGVPASDPMFLDVIDVEQPNLKFKVTNVTLTGMRSCEPELVKLDTKDSSYDYNVGCRHLKTEGQYEVKGEISSMPIEGKGTFQVDHYNYLLLFHGNYGQEFDADQKLHITVKNYKINTEVRDKVVYNYKNLYNGDIVKSAAMHKYANENWPIMDKLIGLPVMEKFMSKFMDNVRDYMKQVTVEHVFPRDV